MRETIAIAGAGPAGSMLAHKLASCSIKVRLYDHKAPWEKPCGGMLGPDTFDEHPELKGYPYPQNLCNRIEYIGPRGESKNVSESVPVEKIIRVVSRIELNRFLLDLAIQSGAEFIGKKILDIAQNDSQWIIKTDDRIHKASIIVGADGVNSIVRKATIGKFPRKHLALTCGYILKGINENQYLTKFLDIEGYLFVISRSDHASAGVGAMLGTVSGKDLFKRLNIFLNKNYSGFEVQRKYAALVPTVTEESFFNKPCCGDNWLLVGDAAGHVHPAVGEGIYYALESAKFAARAILSGDIFSYDGLWREKYGDILKQGATFRKNLAEFANAFSPEMFGIMMYDRAIGGFFSHKRE
jgi:flavin-dependent dehydrogenase